MTTSALVRAAWQTAVLDSPTVRAITPKAFLYDVSVDSQKTAAALIHDTRVNFLTCVVRRATEVLPFGQARYTFQVRVAYYLQQTDVPASVYNLVLDRLEAVDGLVLSALGPTWGGTVDHYQGGSPDDVAAADVDGRQCWRGAMTYTAVRTI
jgi:hypothetical protein